MKIKIILIACICICLFNCGLKKQSFTIINKTVDYNLSEECDSTNIILVTTKFNEDFFKLYKNAELKFLNDKFPSYNPFITWINNKTKWVLDEEDLHSMSENKNHTIQINKNDLNTKKIISLVDFPIFNSDIEKNKDFTKQMINCNYLYQFSLPVFNKNKNKAVVMKKTIGNGVVNFYIYVKEQTKWILVGYSNDYSI